MSNPTSLRPKNPLELAESLIPAALSEGRLNELMEAVRIFHLRAGESLTLLAGEAEEAVQAFSGKVRVVTDGWERSVEADLAGDSRLELPKSGGQVKILAESNAVVCHIDQTGLDFLVLWESISQGCEDDPEMRRRMNKVPRARAFRRLPAEAVEEAVRLMERVEVKAGEDIVRQYEAGDAYYLIDRGDAEVWAEEFPGDDAAMVAELHEGDAFGEYALITGKQRAATVRMRTDGALLRLGKEDFQRLIGRSLIHEVGADLAKAMLDEGYGLIDVRFEEEFDEAYIPGCALLPLSDLRQSARELDREKQYIVYCRSGLRSAVGALILGQLGIQAVSLKGGINQWPFDKESNLPPPPPRRN